MIKMLFACNQIWMISSKGWSKMNTDVAVAFRNADGPMLKDLVRCLDYLNGLKFFKNYKSATWNALDIRPQQIILDVGCGVGFDIIEMARQFPNTAFVGVDKSEGLLDIARSRAKSLSNTRFVINKADQLSFANACFDGARIDRSLQHMKSPDTVIKEMVRVIRPGGRIVVSEPDWGTFVLFNGNEVMSMKMTGLWLQSFAQPFVGRKLGQILNNNRIENIRWQSHALILNRLSDADVVFDLARLKSNCVETGILSSQEADDWWSEAQASSLNGSFMACLNILECCGQTV